MLGLWEYFWDESDWTGVTATASAVVAISLPGGGGPMRVYPYDLESFFEVRKTYLKRVHSAVEKETPSEIISERILLLADQESDTRHIAEIVAERERAYRKAEQAQTARELKAQAATITRLTLQLVELNTRIDDDLILLLLLSE